jgi:uncharacterized membrane protein YfcA
MEIVAFAIWCFLTAAIGGLVGLVLGNIRLPLVLLLTSPAVAGATNLVISAVAVTTASVGHLRAGRVNWGLVAWMGPPSVVGAVAGGLLAGAISGDLLLGVIAAVLLFSGVELLREKHEEHGGPDEGRGGSSKPLDIRAAVLSGAGVGLLGGLVGLILGSLRMPALLRLVGERPERAVGTNVLVGVCVGVAGLVGHLPEAAPDLGLAAAGAAASIPGAALGARLTGRLSERQLVRAIGAVLIVAGVASAVQAIT